MAIQNLSYSEVIERFPQLKECEKEIIDSINLIIKTFENGGKLIIAGNGGSSADAEHFCGELLKGFVKKRKLKDEEHKLFKDIDPNLPSMIQGALPAISLGVSHSTISAFNNDMEPDYVHAQQVWGLANKEDIFFGISTSGNSKNIVHAVNTAKAKSVKTISLTGHSGGKLGELSDLCIKAPANKTHHIQEFHLPIYHAICLEVENYFFHE